MAIGNSAFPQIVSRHYFVPFFEALGVEARKVGVFCAGSLGVNSFWTSWDLRHVKVYGEPTDCSGTVSGHLPAFQPFIAVDGTV